MRYLIIILTLASLLVLMACGKPDIAIRPAGGPAETGSSGPAETGSSGPAETGSSGPDTTGSSIQPAAAEIRDPTAPPTMQCPKRPPA